MMMVNHTHEGNASKQCNASVNLHKETEPQKQIMIDKAAVMSKLKQSLDMSYSSQRPSTLICHEMEGVKKECDQITKELEDCKSLNDLQQQNFTEEIIKNLMQMSSLQMAALKQQNESELKQLKVKISNMSHEMEGIKKERDKINKELEESKSLNDLQRKNFIKEIRKVSQ